MKALLLAAGLGTRLLPLTRELPKCLMPVHGRPLIEYWLRALDTAGVRDILVNTHYLPELVRRYIAGSPWADRITLVHEDELLGTAGTLAGNRAFFGDEPVLLVHADNLCSADLVAFAAAHRDRTPGTCLTMMSFVTDNPRSCGILELDETGVVRAFHEKVANPPGRNANAAVYILEPEVADFAAGQGRAVLDFSTEVIPHFLGRIQAWSNPGYHRDIGAVDSLLLAQSEFPGRIEPLAAESDPWLALCAENDWSLAGRLADALAEATGVPLADRPPASGAGARLVRIARPAEVDELYRDGQCGPDRGSIFVMDQTGPQDAVATGTLAEHGWRVLVICAASTSRA